MGTATLRHSQSWGVVPRIPQGLVPHLSSCGAGMPGVQLLLGPRQEQRGLGMWLLCPGGLQHCSCSHHRNKTDFFFQWVSAGLLQSPGQLQPESRGRGVGKEGNWGLVVGCGALHSLLGLQAPLWGKCPSSLPLQDSAGPRPLLPAALPPCAGETMHSAVLTPPCPKGAPTAQPPSACTGWKKQEAAPRRAWRKPGDCPSSPPAQPQPLPRANPPRPCRKRLATGSLSALLSGSPATATCLSSGGGEAAPAWPQHGTAVSRGGCRSRRRLRSGT